MQYSNKLRAAIPGVLVKGRRPGDPNAKPGPTPQPDGMTVRPRAGRSHFDADYFYQDQNQETESAE